MNNALAFFAFSQSLEEIPQAPVCLFNIFTVWLFLPPSQEQYRFCYQAVIEFLDSFDHYSNFD